MTPEAAKAIETRTINLIADAMLRSDVVRPYAECLRGEWVAMENIDAAIVGRWSESALDWVKLRAGEMNDGRGEDSPNVE